MKPILDCYNGSLAAFESWNLTDFSERKAILDLMAKHLSEPLSRAYQYQLGCAEAAVSETQSLISPTGETNELYTQGRGVGILLVDSANPNGTTAMVAMMTAMLVAGNSVIICTDDVWVQKLFADTTSLLPDGLLQVMAKGRYSELLKQDIRNFAFVGSASDTTQISQALSMRTGAITQLVAETDLETLPNAKDPMLALRFITEKVRSINITAIGGNAMLLEMGNTAH